MRRRFSLLLASPAPTAPSRSTWMKQHLAPLHAVPTRASTMRCFVDIAPTIFFGLRLFAPNFGSCLFLVTDVGHPQLFHFSYIFLTHPSPPFFSFLSLVSLHPTHVLVKEYYSFFFQHI
uniref:Putative secreted protein n=1 Tax=Anopheles triannulatus TaxID=58253 RepID=A0A2M4B2D9_9DIPT